MDNRSLSALLQMLVLIPSAASCYLPSFGKMKFSRPKTAAICACAIIPFSAAAVLIGSAYDLDLNGILLPALAIFFFVYRFTVTLDVPRCLAIYVGVCAIETFPAQFAYALDAHLHPESGAAEMSAEAAAFQLFLSLLLFAAFVRPATGKFSWAVENLDSPKIWYATVVLSTGFLIFNMLAVPRSYSTLYAGRIFRLYIALEAGMMAILVGSYMMFYYVMEVVLERARLRERSQLLEMQARQYTVLQEHMQQTAKLRHDFRHSIRLLATLAEQGDNAGIRSHIAEYETLLDRSSIENYCSNAALNALFGYYHETALSAGIDTDWKIELPDPLPLSELDMTGLFGNLMENAIAGCRTVPEGSRYFCLTAQIQHGNILYIVSTNSFDGNVKRGRDGYRSTKHRGNGIGLAAIAAAAEKYNGTAKFSNNDSEFFADVALKIQS